jgi:hypothetical protein
MVRRTVPRLVATRWRATCRRSRPPDTTSPGCAPHRATSRRLTGASRPRVQRPAPSSASTSPSTSPARARLWVRCPEVCGAKAVALVVSVRSGGDYHARVRFWKRIVAACGIVLSTGAGHQRLDRRDRREQQRRRPDREQRRGHRTDRSECADRRHTAESRDREAPRRPVTHSWRMIPSAYWSLAARPRLAGAAAVRATR